MADRKRPANESEAITSLVEQVPELRPLLQQHLAENGELLSYVVFESDFLRWFVERIRRGDHEPARRFVEAMEPLMTTNVKPPANDRVWNLAGVCFGEGLVMNGDDDVLEIARPWMGPNTWEDVQHMYWYRSGSCRPPLDDRDRPSGKTSGGREHPLCNSHRAKQQWRAARRNTGPVSEPEHPIETYRTYPLTPPQPTKQP